MISDSTKFTQHYQKYRVITILVSQGLSQVHFSLVILTRLRTGALFLPYDVMAYFLFNRMYEYICCIHFSFRTYYDVFISEKNSKHLQNTNEILLRQLNDSKVEISRRQYDREDEEIVFFIETKLMKMFLLFVKRMSLFWWYIITETTRHNCLTY